MYEAIKNFPKQFLYEPEILNKELLASKTEFLVVGMGGSVLAPKLLQTWKPELDIIVQSDYGLKKLTPTELKKKLIILSSYSGNTEETIDAFHKAKALDLSLAVIATGGELLTLAQKNNVPYIKIPDTGIQPRSALGFSIKAFLKLLGEDEELKNITKLSESLNTSDIEKEGKILAEKIKNYVPVIYTSADNMSVAYNWKIKLNETGKIPAFYNVYPELNHNEMTGFDVTNTTKELCEKFYFIFLKDTGDDERIQKRMDILEKLYKNRGLNVETLVMQGQDVWHKIFSSLLLADWTAYHTALIYGLEPEQVPLVEEFKKLVSKK